MNNLTVILDQKASDDDPEKSLFRTYWDKIEKAEKSFASAERKRDRIVNRFNEELLPLEEACCQLNYQLIEKLLSFLEMKSLSMNHKVETIEWAQEGFETLMNSPFRSELDIDKLYQEIHKHESKLIEKPSEEEMDFLKEQMKEMFDDEDIPFGEEGIEDLINASMDGPNSFFEELAKKAREYLEDNPPDEEELVEPRFNTEDKKEDLSEKTLSKLYKRLAQRLHPDRAKNDKDREKRHQLMLELTEAKRNKDTFTLLRMVRDYGEESDAEFSDQQLEHFVSGLQEKLDNIRLKKRSLKTDSSISAVVYSRFHSRTNKEMDKKFQAHKAELKREANEMKSMIKRLKTAKQLKKVLSERQLMHNPFLNMAFDPEWL